jgi:hypothetical protein
MSSAAAPLPALVPFVPRTRTNPEFDLLRACSDPLNRSDTGWLSSQQPNWARLIALAQHHGLIPHLSAALDKNRFHIPDPVQEEVRAENFKNTRIALWLTRELVRILEQLKSRNVDALPYKGPALAEIIYGDVAARQFNDIDILIRARDLPIAISALHELGYEPGLELTPQQQRELLRHGYEYTFDGQHGRNLVELQWNLMPRFYAVDLDVDELFERAVPINISGEPARTLCREDQFLVLCCHAAKHVWAQVSMLRDVAGMLVSQPLDWEFIHAQANRFGIVRIVGITLFLCESLWGTSLPSGSMTQTASRPIVSDLMHRLAAGQEFDPESVSYFRRMLQIRERNNDRCRFVWRLATTPSVKEWSTVRLPSLLFPLYRGVRLFRVAARICTSSW